MSYRKISFFKTCLFFAEANSTSSESIACKCEVPEVHEIKKGQMKCECFQNISCNFSCWFNAWWAMLSVWSPSKCHHLRLHPNTERLKRLWESARQEPPCLFHPVWCLFSSTVCSLCSVFLFEHKEPLTALESYSKRTNTALRQRMLCSVSWMAFRYCETSSIHVLRIFHVLPLKLNKHSASFSGSRSFVFLRCRNQFLVASMPTLPVRNGSWDGQ